METEKGRGRKTGKGENGEDTRSEVLSLVSLCDQWWVILIILFLCFKSVLQKYVFLLQL